MYTVYTKSGCRYCALVKELLDELGEPVIYINCDEELLNDKETLLNSLEKKAGRPHKTFPMVFLDGEFVGGFIELMRLTTTQSKEPHYK